MKYGTAQQWLQAAVRKLEAVLWQYEAVLPGRVQVSVGWVTADKGDSPENYSGQAWDGSVYARDRRTATVFVSPDTTKPLEILLRSSTAMHPVRTRFAVAGCAPPGSHRYAGSHIDTCRNLPPAHRYRNWV